MARKSRTKQHDQHLHDDASIPSLTSHAKSPEPFGPAATFGHNGHCWPRVHARVGFPTPSRHAANAADAVFSVAFEPILIFPKYFGTRWPVGVRCRTSQPRGHRLSQVSARLSYPLPGPARTGRAAHPTARTGSAQGGGALAQASPVEGSRICQGQAHDRALGMNRESE